MPRTKKSTEDSGSSAPVPAVEDAASDDEPTFSSELQATMEQLLAIKEATAEAITSLKKLEKRHAKELREVNKRRRAPTDAASAKETRANCVFTRPLPLNDGLAHLLNKVPGHMMSPTEITSKLTIYIEEHSLKDTTGKLIKMNGALSKALKLEEGSTVSYKDMQRALYAVLKEITNETEKR
jgi:hypothetical protein